MNQQIDGFTKFFDGSIRFPNRHSIVKSAHESSVAAWCCPAPVRSHNTRRWEFLGILIFDVPYQHTRAIVNAVLLAMTAKVWAMSPELRYIRTAPVQLAIPGCAHCLRLPTRCYTGG